MLHLKLLLKCVCINISMCTFVYKFYNCCRTINVSLPDNARYNRTLYLHIFICPRGKSPFKSPSNTQSIHAIVPQTTHVIPESTAFNLVGGSDEPKQVGKIYAIHTLCGMCLLVHILFLSSTFVFAKYHVTVTFECVFCVVEQYCIP